MRQRVMSPTENPVPFSTQRQTLQRPAILPVGCCFRSWALPPRDLPRFCVERTTVLVLAGIRCEMDPRSFRPQWDGAFHGQRGLQGDRMSDRMFQVILAGGVALVGCGGAFRPRGRDAYADAAADTRVGVPTEGPPR